MSEACEALLAAPFPVDRQVEAAIRIAGSSVRERDALGFSSRLFALVSLPHTDPGNERVWARKNGDALLTLTPGFRSTPGGGFESVGYPFGVLPRLLLIFLASRAIRSGSRQIELGEHLVDFLRELRLPYESRRIAVVRDQAERLFSASFRYSFRTTVVVGGANASFAERFLLWWDSKSAGLPSHVVLNESFFAEISENRFPVDLDAIAGLRQSPLSLDLYVWFAYRLYSLNHPVRIRYREIEQHVGSRYKSTNEFAREFRKALLRVRAIWPDLQCEPVFGGIRLAPSRLHVARLK